MPPSKKHNQTGGIAADQLRAFIERVERLEEEKAGIADDIKEVFAQAKGQGFDTKTMKQIIRLRKMEPAEREEYEALLDIYKAALGMLDGTPLGEAAIRKLTQEEEKAKENSEADEPAKPGAEEAPTNEERKPEPDPGPTMDETRAMARKAAQDGRPVTDNPFPARDPRRAAFDEEWCRSTGSDGMELPEAWRRTPKKQEEDHGEEE